MLTRRLLLAASLCLALAAPAAAGDRQAFTKEAFAAAQAAGQPILIHIYADWCPTCRAQEPILEKLHGDPRFQVLKVFRVDFDSQKDAVRSFRANSQSTLIVFKGAKETGRSVGDSNQASIAALLGKAF